MTDATLVNTTLAALRMASDELYHRASSHDGDGRYTCAGPGYCPKCTVDDAMRRLAQIAAVYEDAAEE